MSYDRHQAARASAILTGAEVAASTLDLTKVHDSRVTVTAAFTVGSLTNCIIRAYASQDGSTWDLAYDSNGNACVVTLTASDTISIALPCLSGYKFARVTAVGTGTATSSLLALTYNWLRKGSQI
jgi:hypothetical protein